MSVVVMVNEKFREGVPPWEVMDLILRSIVGMVLCVSISWLICFCYR